MRRFDFKVLGPFEVSAGEEPLVLGGTRQRALLALLLLNGGRVVPRDRIVDALWGESPPPTAANSVQVAVHALRKLLGPERVQTRGAGYRIAVQPGELDLDRFEAVLGRARDESPVRAAETLREALSLRRGPLLSDLPDAPFLAAERDRVEELVLLALERRLDADLALGRHRELVAELEALAAEHPYREGLRARLMLALYRAGRQADALEAYRRGRATLVEDLGVDPSRELQELEAAILRQDAALDPPAERDRAAATNLPAAARPLVGRELELAAVTALVRARDARLVTLTGPGGTGKTRLALEAAATLRSGFEGGVFFADLAPLSDATLVGPTAARALGVRDVSDESLVERIAATVRDRETLLVLDNFEHVVEAAPLVAELLATAPLLRVLATSREPLRVQAEHEYRVPPLALPSAEDGLDAARRAEAVELFVARARAARPDFELTSANVGAVVGICRALDGLPLALELAAPRVKLLSPETLLERLRSRREALAEAERDVPERQRTLRATIDWSYDLLAPAERALLARLSVFSGGWTLDAAEEVCEADLAGLGSLVEKSLVQSGGPPDREPRFSMLETVREYAFERLSSAPDEASTRLRHADYFARLAEALEAELHTRAPLETIELEHDNVRAALGHSVSAGEGELALRLTAMARFWYVRGFHREGRGWIEQALALSHVPSERRVAALYWSAVLAWRTSDVAAAIEKARESLDLARATDDEAGAMMALTALGLAHFGAGDLVASRHFHEQSLELAQRLGRARETARCLANLADLAFLLHEHDVGDELAAESVQIARRIGDWEIAGVALLVLAASKLETERRTEALPLVVESLRSFHHTEFKDYLASSLVALARALAPDDAHLAARLLGAARTIRDPLERSPFTWEQAWFDDTHAFVREALGDAAAQAEVDAGGRALEATIEEALARSA